jgi:serine/threonine protein kinase
MATAAPSGLLARYQKIEKPVGEGTYGVVYKAKDRATGMHAAVGVMLGCRTFVAPSSKL